MTLRTPVSPAVPLSASTALSDAAIRLFSPAHLRRGPVQRAQKLHAQGVTIAAAAKTAAAQGKGFVAEVVQSADYATSAGALLRPYSAHPNPVANDPMADLLVWGMVDAAVKARPQLKVGSPAYVLRAARRGGYESLLVNEETRNALVERGSIEAEAVSVALGAEGVEARTIRADECERLCVDTLTAVLSESPHMTQIDMLGMSAVAGAKDGLVDFGISLLTEVVDAAVSGRVVRWEATITSALRSAGRAWARTTLQTRVLLGQFVTEARDAFCGRLLHRLASSALVLSAVSEVIVEAAIDLYAVHLGTMTWEEFLRGLGVHAFTAAGAAAGASAAAMLTRNMPWWVQLGAMLAGGYFGAKLGRVGGEALFLPAPVPGHVAA